MKPIKQSKCAIICPKRQRVITHPFQTKIHIHRYTDNSHPYTHTLMHTHSLLSFLLPLQCLSVSLSPVGIIYHYMQQTEASQLLCPGNACSHAAIKAKRHPLPPAPMGAWQQKGKESRGKEEGEGTVREGYKQGDQEGRGR